VFDRWRHVFERHGLKEPLTAWRRLTRRQTGERDK
jgi:hypothetical protein